jgi:hypothetical protein
VHRKCKGCGIEFTPSRPNQKYHNDACRKTRYERTTAGRQRKVKYSLSLSGTIAQAKYDRSYQGEDRKRRYYTAHPKPRKARYFFPGQIPANRSEAELILEHIEQQPKKVRSTVRTAAKKLLKPIYAHRDKCMSTSVKKSEIIREETLRIAQERAIRPEEAFEVLREEWTKRGVEPQRWFKWENYCTLDEWEELQIHRHEAKILALVAERNCEGTAAPILFSDVMVEYKNRLRKEALSEVLFRATMQGKINHGGKYTTEQFNRCMNDTASTFDFQWAGGGPIFIGPEKDWPTIKVKYRRAGPVDRGVTGMPSTTESSNADPC